MAKTTKYLTNPEISKAKSKEYIFSDSEGLALSVKSTGSKL